MPKKGRNALILPAFPYFFGGQESTVISSLSFYLKTSAQDETTIAKIYEGLETDYMSPKMPDCLISLL